MNALTRRAFTLIDLCILLAMLSFLTCAHLAVIGSGRESSNRIKCASNLKQIGLAMLMYCNENRGNFPRTLYDGVGGTPTEFTGVGALNPFTPGGPALNDVSAPLYLLLRTQDITSDVFVCPVVPNASALNYGNGGVKSSSNFPGRANLSYSYINPYPTPAAVKKRFGLNFTLSSDFAISSDINSGNPALLTTLSSADRAQMRLVNSPNHAWEGQNVLFADGHVEFFATVYCGSPRAGMNFRDNIFTYGSTAANEPGTGIKGSPSDPADSILLPTALAGPSPPPLPPIPFEMTPLHWMGAFLLLVLVSSGVLMLMYWLGRRGPAGR